jgi:hypothetical protein
MPVIPICLLDPSVIPSEVAAATERRDLLFLSAVMFFSGLLMPVHPRTQLRR